MRLKSYPAVLVATLLFAVVASCGYTENQNRRPLIARIPQPIGIYVLDMPEGWERRDTSIGTGARPVPMRMYYPTNGLHDSAAPAVNYFALFMQGQSVGAYLDRNATQLVENNPTITIIDKGDMEISGYSGKYMRYSISVDGIPRELVCFLIPVEGFAHMITCSVNRGFMQEYLPLFEWIAQSFRNR